MPSGPDGGIDPAAFGVDGQQVTQSTHVQALLGAFTAVTKQVRGTLA
jgi:hypothetical protein